MVLQMLDGGWAQGIGLVEVLAQCHGHPWAVTLHPKSLSYRGAPGELWLQMQARFIPWLCAALLGN
jgi:hypothetical protein